MVGGMMRWSGSKVWVRMVVPVPTARCHHRTRRDWSRILRWMQRWMQRWSSCSEGLCSFTIEGRCEEGRRGEGSAVHVLKTL